MALRPCKVLIVGGGIAGLALALMLENNAVDYVLLEAYPKIVTDVGAGICMMPNGLRILDQLGCYEDLLSHTQTSVTSISWRDLEGKVLGSVDGSVLNERYGYHALCMDRQGLLATLYGRISDKSKLLTQKRVATVEHAESCVEVTTTDGSIYRGDILVGADGTHSCIRQEMTRLARNLRIQDDYNDEPPATYSCVFGVSTGIPGIAPGCLDFVVNHQSSYVIGSGPENRTYWFLMSNMGKTFYGADIPRLDNKELDALAQKHWNDHITPDVRFSDLYKNRMSTIYTPMRECVDRKWHLNRVMLIGDAVHKSHGGFIATILVGCTINDRAAQHLSEGPGSPRPEVVPVDGDGPFSAANGRYGDPGTQRYCFEQVLKIITGSNRAMGHDLSPGGLVENA
ncbi:hypothetical protein BDV36DRAFT_282175 [Aspergillus pseudocaelatus]|uniref:FAD-binding domain-containing protein n=1 Tax=Aspergillus pseudocaelatus TaxID=1825620 RepID=A0ABQ6WQX1_9EURO|nr:hypothetical protein BDV36DRAFT_282175 [Aspergillus pseudocaelatus]